METNLKAITLVLLLWIFQSGFAQVQVEMYFNDQLIDEEQTFLEDDLDKITVRVALADIEKYDKVKFYLKYDYSDMKFIVKKLAQNVHTTLPQMAFYPTDKVFKDRIGDKTYLEFKIVRTPDAQDYLVVDDDLSINGLKWHIVMDGYFEDGYESYYDDWSNSYKTRKKYRFSKKLGETKKAKYIKEAM